MNKSELIDAIAGDAELTKAAAGKALDAVISNITKAVAAGDTVQLTGFGSFGVSERSAREGRNPSTGAKIKIAASKSPKFTAGKAFKDLLNTKK